MKFLTDMRIWQKAILPLALMGMACCGITFFMSARMGAIETFYSALLDRDSTAAIDASRSDTNTSDIWALAYQTIAETDVARMQDLIQQMEAARAGEAGKGFAVLASEVKSLAHRTAAATEQISTQIRQIQGATKKAVEAIRAINTKIEEISGIASSIAAAVEQQGAATSEIARNVQQTAASTQEVTMNIAGVSRAANDTGVAANQVLGAAGELSQKAEELSREVKSFISDVRAA